MSYFFLAGEIRNRLAGEEAYRFAKKLVKSGVKYWQVLPLVQTGFGDSPYSSVSCDSGNPYFIDLDDLAKQGLLTKEDLKEAEQKGEIDYGTLYRERFLILRKAFSRFFFDDETFREFIKSGVAEDGKNRLRRFLCELGDSVKRS